MNYILINNKIMKGKKMPLHVYSDHPNWYDSKMYLNSKDYLDWLSSLQPCEISESELDKVKVNLRLPLDLTNPIEVTDIISDNNGVITFKEKANFNVIIVDEPKPKQVESEIEAVDVLLNTFGQFCTLSGIKLTDSNKVGQAVIDFLKSDIYQTFKNRKI